MDNHLTSIWKKVLSEMKPKVSKGNFNVILNPTFLVSLEDDIPTIGAPNNMIVGLLQNRFLTEIKSILDKQTGKDISILIIQKSLPSVAKNKEQVKMGPLFSESETAQAPVEKSLVGHLPRVRSDFTFETFAVSGTNQLAFVSAKTVASNIGKSYNPLFIYGPVGVGKTHLMHAIANTAYQKEPDKKIIYITSEEFTNEVVEAIRNNETARMKRRFRSAYILLIDDVQFFEGKEKVQEELFHTFNILVDNVSQIGLTSDRPPQELKKLEKRLSSRFAGGLIVDIGKPDLELKSAIVKNKANKLGHNIPTDAALYLAGHAEDTRSLEGLLHRTITQLSSANPNITLETAQQALGNIVKETIGTTNHVHPDDIINYVCSYYRIKQSQLKSPKRDASLVRARQVCMYLLKLELGVTLVEIGNLLGGRDHTTILHGVDKIKELVENEDKVSGDIVGITKYFRG